ncbi:MAG: hypothetical protein O3B76_08465 [Proteobacteria bacterium]|nr:hypothetical protein [Pseudomonadota bacterium]MDA1022451.1 hypothetical protein [Pseudomonadota bacterium]
MEIIAAATSLARPSAAAGGDGKDQRRLAGDSVQRSQVPEPRRLSQAPGSRAAPLEAGDDVNSVPGQHAARGVAHIPRHEDGNSGGGHDGFFP